jgi:hypothetical protein
MKVKRHIIHSPAEMGAWKEIILHALDEIGKRSGGRYTSEEVFAYLRDFRIMDEPKFALWLGIDEERLVKGGNVQDAVTGLTTLDISYDEVGYPLVFVSRGWTRPDDHGRTFKAVFPLIQQWGKERGCKAIVTMTERSSAANAPKRTDLACLLPRMRGLAAYWRQMAKLGFTLRESSFERPITQ